LKEKRKSNPDSFKKTINKKGGKVYVQKGKKRAKRTPVVTSQTILAQQNQEEKLSKRSQEKGGGRKIQRKRDIQRTSAKKKLDEGPGQNQH